MKSVRAFVVAVLCVLTVGAVAGTAAAESARADSRSASAILLNGDSGWG
ncbi:hypothetical protein GCM10018785_16320 [Streptomyces longispororuber]|uniref:Uncharacterized protein n=1 Tax=Streptomyces longispororuber TaxID=68230 RepID=A0A918ZDX9_9ACTN|nr:hypothetical protein [Streptomyces longispororuber]GHE47370.1 hypothetical protein GCM10018785_16320 [Streptomyces longispororuber]